MMLYFVIIFLQLQHFNCVIVSMVGVHTLTPTFIIRILTETIIIGLTACPSSALLSACRRVELLNCCLRITLFMLSSRKNKVVISGNLGKIIPLAWENNNVEIMIYANGELEKTN